MDFLSRDPMPVADHFMAHRPRARHADTAIAEAAAVADTSEAVVQSAHRTVVGTDGIEVCEQCFACTRDKQSLWEHARDVHGDDRRLQCSAAGCDRRFSSMFASAAHRSHHLACGDGRVPYTCELCGRLSSNRLALDKHVANVHPTARAALCGVCGRYVGDVRSLTEHVSTAHGAQIWSEVVACKAVGSGVGPERTRRTIRCDVCGKRYGNYRLMRSHRQLHGVNDQDATEQEPATGSGPSRCATNLSAPVLR